MTTKIPAVEAGALLGGRGWCGRVEEDGREEGVAVPLPSCVCFVAVARKVVYVSQQTRKFTDGVSVICPNNRKRRTFVGRDVVGWDPVQHGRHNDLVLTLNLDRCPDTFFLGSDLLVDEDNVLMCGTSGLHRFQSGLVCRV